MQDNDDNDRLDKTQEPGQCDSPTGKVWNLIQFPFKRIPPAPRHETYAISAAKKRKNTLCNVSWKQLNKTKMICKQSR